MRQHRHRVHEDAAADQEHRGGARDRQELHQPRCAVEQAASERCPCPALLCQMHAGVVQFHDACDQSIDADRHRQGDQHQHQCLLGEGPPVDHAERQHDDLRRKYEVGPYRALDLVLLERDEVHFLIGQGMHQRFMLACVLGARMQEAVDQLLHALVHEIGPADHHQRNDQHRQPGADRQRCGHQDGLVLERTLCHRPDHRQLAGGLHPGDLLRVERKVVAEHPGGFLGRKLGEDGDIVQHAGDIVEQGQKAGAGHGGVTDGKRPPLSPIPMCLGCDGGRRCRGASLASFPRC